MLVNKQTSIHGSLDATWIKQELREHTGEGDRTKGGSNDRAGPKKSSGDGGEHFVCRLRVEW